MWYLLAEVTDASAWQRAGFIATSIVTTLATLSGAAAYVWKKHSDRKFELEKLETARREKVESETAAVWREFIDHLKDQSRMSEERDKATTASFQTLAASVQVQTTSLQAQTPVLEKLVNTAVETKDAVKDMHQDLTQAVTDPTRLPVPCRFQPVCKYVKPRKTKHA